MVVLLDTDRLDAAERQSALREVLASSTAPHETRFVGPADSSRVRLSGWALGADAALIVESSTGIEHRRDARHDHASAPERVAFVLHGGPSGTYSRGEGGEAPLRSGGLYVTDLSSHFVYHRAGPGEVRILQLERSALGLSAEAVCAAASGVIRSPLYGLFRAQLLELVGAAERISHSAEAGNVAAAVARLAASLLETAGEDDAAATDYLKERIELYLRMNFRRRDLSPEFIAYAHNISVRYLFKLWSNQPQTLMETVYALRLDHARQLLAADPTLPVARVAFESGFENASHFSRRFRGVYGVVPSELRGRSA
ncbi:MAG TPA: helix-turn-helix domain-containing protein [Gryllotalpicola sp.]